MSREPLSADQLDALSSQIRAALGPELAEQIRASEMAERDRVWESANDTLYLMVSDLREHRREDDPSCPDPTCPGNKFIGWAMSADHQELSIMLSAAIAALSGYMPDNIEAQCAAAIARDEARERNEDPMSDMVREHAGSTAALVMPVDRTHRED